MLHDFRYKILTLVLLCPSWVYANSVAESEIHNNISATTGIITFLTSHESVSAGTYAVEQTGPNNTSSSFSTFKIPYRHSYPVHDNTSQWSMLMGYGKFDMNQKFSVTEGTAASNSKANSLSAGIGYSKALNPDIRWISRLELALTQMNHQYSVPTVINSASTPPQIGTVNFKWQTTAVSLIPSIGINLPLFPQKTHWTFQTKAVYLYTTSIFEKNEIEKVSTSSGLWSNQLDFGELWTLQFGSWGVAINPQLKRTDAYGKVQQALATYYWYEAHLNFRLKSTEHQWWDNLEYGFSYLQGQHFRGGQLTISFQLDNFFKAGY